MGDTDNENRRKNKQHESSLEKTSIMKTIHMNNTSVTELIELFRFTTTEEKTTTEVQNHHENRQRPSLNRES